VSTLARVVVVLCMALFVPAALRPASLAAQSAPTLCSEVPPNIQVSTLLQPIVSDLLRKSATFRRQCEIIAAAERLRVVVRGIPPAGLSSMPRARAKIAHFSYGLIRVVIDMPMLADHAELLPHEFEHVIEQLEGLDLSALVRAGGYGVVQLDDGAFETARAKAAGLAAAQEVYADTDPAVGAAMGRMSRVFRVLRSRAAREAGRRPLGAPSRR
jgi:hypothetical protein